MSRLKIWIIVASILVVVGAAVAAIGFAAGDFKFNGQTVSRQIDIDEKFDKIVIDVNTADVNLELLENIDAQPFVNIVESENPSVQHSVEVKDGVLKIKLNDTRKWYEYIGIGWGNWKINVCLSKTDLDSLDVEINTGDVTVPSAFSFNNANIESNTGDIKWSAAVSEKLELETDTGDIRLSGVTSPNIQISTHTGNLAISDTSAANSLTIDTNTGNVSLANTVTQGAMSVKTATGNVTLNDCDGRFVFIKTNTGNVNGTLLSPKAFAAISSFWAWSPK
jgi:DUF4097 and DUF4098 domain-containing protein YvlB